MTRDEAKSNLAKCNLIGGIQFTHVYLGWKTYTCCKKQNLKSEIKLHILYAIYWTTLLRWDWRRKLYYGCKLLVKKDTMLDSLNAKERSYDNNTNGNNFTIRKVNLIFVFIVVVWIFFSNKYMIQNPVLTRGMVLYPRWTWLISWKLVMNCILVYLVYPGNPIYCEQKYLKLL